MIRAAGLLIVTPDDRALLLLRGNGGDAPLTWCCPGGHQEDGETLEQCAIRETIEETGFDAGQATLKTHTRRISEALAVIVDTPAASPPETEAAAPGAVQAPPEGVDFTTYLVSGGEEFVPTLCPEHIGYAWAPIANPPEPLHPGVRVALQRLSMDELGVARAIAAGDLVSPQQYQTMWLFAIRITGTGTSYRPEIKDKKGKTEREAEFVWRPPAEYLHEDFLARCAGLPVIWEHPEKSLLNSKEFENRIIGAIMLAYIKGDDVWGIARIYDADAIAALTAAADDPDEILSTSPGVGFKPGTNRKLRLPEGQMILVEGKPDVVDHIAICALGTWDKGGPPTGIEVAEAVNDAIQTPQPLDLGLLPAMAAALNLKLSLTARQTSN